MVLKAGRGRLARNGGKADRFMRFHMETDFHGPSEAWISRQGAARRGPAAPGPRLAARADKANAPAMVWASLVREAQAASENAKQGTTDLARAPLDDPAHWPALDAPRPPALGDRNALQDSDDEDLVYGRAPSSVFETRMEGDARDRREWICLSNKRYAEALLDVDAIHASSHASGDEVGAKSLEATTLEAADEWLVVDLCAGSGADSVSSGASEASTLLEQHL